jgi:hypothetical protein
MSANIGEKTILYSWLLNSGGFLGEVELTGKIAPLIRGADGATCRPTPNKEKEPGTKTGLSHPI